MINDRSKVLLAFLLFLGVICMTGADWEDRLDAEHRIQIEQINANTALRILRGRSLDMPPQHVDTPQFVGKINHDRQFEYLREKYRQSRLNVEKENGQ